MNDPPDERPPLAVAAEWTSRVTTISLEMVLPGLVGFWIDRQLGTVMVFLVLGVILGMTTGTMHLVRLASSTSSARREDRNSSKNKPSEDNSESSPRT